MLEKVVSGAQTGADQAGIVSARQAGFLTGGWIPAGRKTLAGPLSPEYCKRYGLREHSGGYRDRTWQNVADSDGTIRLALDFQSPGEKCTMRALLEFHRPFFNVHLRRPRDVRDAVAWLEQNDIRILNVSGNAQRFPDFDMFRKTHDYLMRVFELLRGENQ